MKDNYIDLLKSRYACKAFDSSKEVSEDIVNRLKEGLNLTASSFGLQPFKFLFVTNKELRENLVKDSFHQRQVADCSHLIVLTIRTDLNEKFVQDYIDNIVKTRRIEESNLADYKNMMLGFINSKSQEEKELWAIKQTYILLGNILSQCAAEGIDSCPMEGFNPIAYNEALGLDKLNLKSTLLIPIGYRSSEDYYAALPKVRQELNDIVIDIK